MDITEISCNSCTWKHTCELREVELKTSDLWSDAHNFCNNHPDLEGMEDVSGELEETRETLDDRIRDIEDLEDDVDTLKDLIHDLRQEVSLLNELILDMEPSLPSEED